MNNSSVEPWRPAVAGAEKLNVTSEADVGLGGLTDRRTAEPAVDGPEAEPECVADVEPPPQAASRRTVANTDRAQRFIDQLLTNERSSRRASAVTGAPWASRSRSKSRLSSVR